MALTKRIDGTYTINASGIALVDDRNMTAGTGITQTATAIVKHSVVTFGTIIETTIIFDLTGLRSGSNGDIIGGAAAANSHYGQILTAVNGTILHGFMKCLEAPAGGEPNIDLFSATVSTGTEDAAISALTETKLLDVGGDWISRSVTEDESASSDRITADSSTTSADSVPGIGVMESSIETVPPANGFLYLVTGGAGTDAAYTAGKFLIKLYGYA